MTIQTGSLFLVTKVFVPIDFSSASYASLDAASDIARAFKASIYLLHVIPMLPTAQEDAALGVNFYPEAAALTAAQVEAEKRLNLMVERLRAGGLAAGFGVETGNDVVGNILMVMKREEADMLVLSTHGVSGWRAVVFGSIAEKLVKLVHCPLLLLHAPRPVAHTREEDAAEAETLSLQPF